MSSQTPMMKQYWSIKKENPSAILFFRMGDFYEMFGDDAVAASKVLNIALTTRDKSSDNPIPMCGIPYHAIGSYLPKMIKGGFKVAVCEQTENPKQAKGIVKREVMKVITPGAVMEPSMLDEREHNFLVAVSISKRGFGLSACDLSTGLFRVCEFIGDSALSDLLSEIEKTKPKQVLVPSTIDDKSPLLSKELHSSYKNIIDSLEGWIFAEDNARHTLLDKFDVASLDGFGLEGMGLAMSAGGAVISYLKDTQKGALDQITSITCHNPTDFMLLDPSTIRNLELTKSLMENSRKGSLLELMDETKTAMGARQLAEWIIRPLIKVELINERLETVSFFKNDEGLLESVRDILARMGDLARIAGRVAQPSCSPRDLLSLRESLRELPPLRRLIERVDTSFGKGWMELWNDLEETFNLLERAIADEPPMHAKDGGAIRSGYSEQLDDLVAIKTDSRKMILKLEEDEKARTGITALRVKYNKVYGYFIEVSKRQAGDIPEDWMRKQSLVNTERFISPRLKELEEKILSAEENAIGIELSLYNAVAEKVRAVARAVQTMANITGEIDTLSSLSHLATRNEYARPEINDGDIIEIKGGRHPIIESSHLDEKFVPNDAILNRGESLLSIITGPNMAGKSTYIRQVAIITLMAQTGSYIPVDSAVIGVCDTIFTRVGAQDHLQKGQSTFMVEMNETALILNNATSKSLIVLDEIGRGTSTFDGISIAWAVAEYIHKIGARTLFATHYHELTELSDSMPGVKNLSVAVKEWNEEIIFLRKIVEEGADKSYGIQVARLAGLPNEVIKRAGEILTQLEANELDASGHPKLKSKEAEEKKDFQVSLFSPQVSETEEELKKLDIDRLTPVEALNKLSEFKKKLLP